MTLRGTFNLLAVMGFVLLLAAMPVAFLDTAAAELMQDLSLIPFLAAFGVILLDRRPKR